MFHEHDLDTFRHRTHCKGDRAMPMESIGRDAAAELVSRVSWDRMATLADATRPYVPAVLAEIDTLQDARRRRPAALARRAVLFGIATPNRDERDSLSWALAADRAAATDPAELAATRYTHVATGRDDCRMGLREQLAKAIADVDALRGAGPADLTPERLTVVRGVGPKVARMITAVANPDARVWTVDLWHGRQLLWAAGLEYRCKVAITPPGYAALESLWMEYRDRYLPDLPMFAAQWSTWNVADGRHNSHAALWADLAA
jgi:hypothetical protein